MKNIRRICVVLLSSFFAIVVASIFFIRLESNFYTYNAIDALPHAEAALVPGAAVLADGTLSPVLQDRVDAAIALYKAHVVEKILVSGDNSTLTHNEVNPARDYLIAHGIPSEDIFLDHAGFDTYSSMYRARDIFLVTSTIIATQSFHLPRAIFIARELGIQAYGFTASNDHVSLWNYVREWPADIKALWELATHAKPQYLGDTIPITGNGSD